MTRMLKNMRFIHFDGSEVTVMFPKDAFMQLRILEKNKKGEIEAALSEAFGQPITVRMLLEGDSAQKSGIDPQVRTALNQAFEVFGRENVSVEE